jgi:glycosyltransferase involved in cell wall biosynthesis
MTRPRRARVMMTADTVGGVWTYATALARELCRRGFEITLVTLGPEPNREQMSDLRRVRGLVIERTQLPLEWMDPEGRHFARALDQLSATARRVKPDVVHLNSYREAAGEFAAPVLVVAHSCVQSWWWACRGEAPSDPRWRPYMDNVAVGLEAAERWVAPTAAFRDTIERLYVPSRRGDVIWNGADLKTRGSPKEPFIVAAGQLWDEAKNVTLLEHIAARVQWPIRVAGPAGAHAKSDADCVNALGTLPHHALLDVMARAAVLVAPAVYEPFGLTVLEAAASGCALVLSDIPSFRELWDGAALFVDPRDPIALQGVLTHLTRNEPLRNEMQRRARRRARRYSLRAMADAYVDLYRELLRAGAPLSRHHLVEARP